MRSITRPVQDLYRSFAARDPDALRSLLSPTFVGHVSAGMPCGVGGRHDGPEAMLAEVWLPVFALYDVTPVPETTRVAGDGSVVVHGWYTGTCRSSGEEMRAEFVHLIELDGDKIAVLRQVTDTASWPPQP